MLIHQMNIIWFSAHLNGNHIDNSHYHSDVLAYERYKGLYPSNPHTHHLNLNSWLHWQDDKLSRQNESVSHCSSSKHMDSKGFVLCGLWGFYVPLGCKMRKTIR